MIIYHFLYILSIKIFYCGHFNQTIRLMINSEYSAEKIKNMFIKNTELLIKRRRRIIKICKLKNITHVGSEFYDFIFEDSILSGKYNFFFNLTGDDEFLGKFYFKNDISNGEFKTYMVDDPVLLKNLEKNQTCSCYN